MARYHLNPKTGDPGVCRATVACPYGDLARDHYGSKEEARAAYERAQQAFTRPDGVRAIPRPLALDSETVKLLDRIAASGAEPLVVGGTVRDSLATGAVPKDVDVEVHGVSNMDELVELLKRNGYRVDEVGKSFGVIKTVLPNGMDIDISLPRRDNLVGEGHRGFEVEVDASLSLTEAAARRDFTINALYYDHRQQVILDAHGGMADWEAKRLRHVSDAFSEDPLRVLRAMQFASRFDLTLAPETAAEAKSIKGQFSSLSTERVQEEWRKLFTKGKSMERGLAALHETGWDEHFGFDRLDRAVAAADATAAMAAADERGLEREGYGPGALAKHLPVQDRARFLKQAIVGDKLANRMLRLGQVEEPDAYTHREIKRWARHEVKAGGGSIKEWDTLNGPFLHPGIRERIREAAVATNSWDRPNEDLVTGQAILDKTGSSKGGKWVGQLMKEAARAQDDEVFTTQAQADAWLTARLENFTPTGR